MSYYDSAVRGSIIAFSKADCKGHFKRFCASHYEKEDKRAEYPAFDLYDRNVGIDQIYSVMVPKGWAAELTDANGDIKVIHGKWRKEEEEKGDDQELTCYNLEQEWQEDAV